jgi:hypothetical protein
MSATRHTGRKPLAYHFAKDSALGTSACGTPGMVATSPMSVTCERCLKLPAFKAALGIVSRYAGSDALTDEQETPR